MNAEQQIELIKQARALLARAIAGGDLPQIEAILHSADMELHWALWNLGEPVALRPEFETHI